MITLNGKFRPGIEGIDWLDMGIGEGGWQPRSSGCGVVPRSAWWLDGSPNHESHKMSDLDGEKRPAAAGQWGLARTTG